VDCEKANLICKAAANNAPASVAIQKNVCTCSRILRLKTQAKAELETGGLPGTDPNHHERTKPANIPGIVIVSGRIRRRAQFTVNTIKTITNPA
jgi:hypothetical protein